MFSKAIKMLIKYVSIFKLIHCFPRPEDLHFNSFMSDTAQNPEEQSHNEQFNLIEGDIVPEINRDGSERSFNDITIRQWDYHIIPYEVSWFSNAIASLHQTI